MKQCIVNLASEYGWYPKGQARLINSLKGNYPGDHMAFMGESSVGAPSHADCNYGFKPYALEKARQAGYDIVLWLDCSMWLIKDIQPLFHKIAEIGYWYEDAEVNTGQFSSDASLFKMGLDREEAMQMPMMSSGVLGLDLRKDAPNEFLNQWRYYADAGAFNGAWSNHNKECSADPRVLGHRHDQTVASVLAHRLGMKVQPKIFMRYYTTEPVPETTCIFAQGM